MQPRSLISGWLILVALSMVTTALTVVDAPGPLATAVAAGVLLLAWSKARIILSRYLGLSGSRFWMGAFSGAIAGFLVTVFAIHLYAMRG